MYKKSVAGLIVCLGLVFCSDTSAASTKTHTIGLLIVATGKYTQWVQPLITSADQFFLNDHEVTYFVFTDSEQYLTGDNAFTSDRKVQVLHHNRLGWPYDTMMRPKVYYDYRHELQSMDYLFAIDADMLFVDSVGNEILGHLTATQHPGYVGRRGTYENRKLSTAYVAPTEEDCYFAGGFNGGIASEYLKLCKTVTDNILQDLKRKIVAIWHDESHINRYFIDNPPEVILSPSYCYPEELQLPYKKRLLALCKDQEKREEVRK